MAKRKKQAVVPKRVMNKCKMQPCKKQTAYMRRVDGTPEHYCADHWKKVVESKKEFAIAVVRAAKEEAAKNKSASVKRRVKKPAKRKVKVKK